jgi:lipopolysaccharide export system protein LptA
MPLPIYRLRRILAATAALITLLVAGMYFYARMRIRDVRNEVSQRLPFEISKTANGFQISKSDGKRTLFTVQASDVKQFRLNGNAELHNVNIVLYGRDSSRFDQIYGDDFSFDQKTGNVTAKGDVQIELVANPAGTSGPDQSLPKEVKNPIHLKTRDLVFNKDSGDAATDARVEFRMAQASGWAVGVRYAGKSNTLTLLSQVHIVTTGPDSSAINAEHGVITNDPRVIVLDYPHLDREGVTMQSDHATFYLGADNNVERIVANDHVSAETQPEKKGTSEGGPPVRSRSDQAEFLLTGKQNLLRTGILTGNVHVEQDGPQPIQGDAGRVILDFAARNAGRNEVQKIHALDGARLIQHAVQDGASQPIAQPAKSSGLASGPQNFELTAPAIDFILSAGNVLDHAVTSGAAKIVITPASETAASQKTMVTAGKFTAQFAASDGKNRITDMHGAPDARVVNSVPGAPDRVSTSEAVDAIFLPHGGIDSITQQGNVAYTDNQAPDKRMQAWASTAHYTPADQILILTGSAPTANPRVTSGSMATTAKTVRINRATDDALAEGDVKTTYSDVKEQPDGALLASSSPIHVTARTMTAHHDSGLALYTGNARLWQDANIVEAPSIEFDRDRRFVTAQGTATQLARTVLVQKEGVQKAVDQSAAPKSTKSSTENPVSKPKISGKRSGRESQQESQKDNPLGNSSPIAITAPKLTYSDTERKAHYEGGVFAQGVDFTARAKSADAYLVPRNQTSPNQSSTGLGSGQSQLDHMIAYDDVVITQPNRHADGQKLVYTVADDKFVLTGGPPTGPPSIFDAEQGKITGVSLTFFRSDDRVLVEGKASTPVVTQTRVAR